MRNYRDFVGFVFSTASLSGFVGSSCVRGLIDYLLLGRQRVKESGGSPVLGPVVCVALMLYCAVVFFTTFGLLVYHLCLIAKNQTTNEDLKKVYQNVRASSIALAALDVGCDRALACLVLSLDNSSDAKLCWCERTGAKLA